MGMLRGLFELWVVVAYIAVALVFAAWWLLLLPFAIALVIIVVTIIQIRLGDER